MSDKPAVSKSKQPKRRTQPVQPKEVHELKITLKGSKPAIWRHIAVSSDIRLSKLHEVIQITMGWANYHLHQFIIPNTRPKPTREKLASLDFQARSEMLAMHRDPCWSDPRMEIEGAEDERKVSLNKLAPRVGSKFIYEYDFGDGWEHQIEAVKIGPPTEGMRYPVCLAGKLACPPEDCGGIWGYYDMLEILKDPKHERFEELSEWIGGEFDAEYFNLEQANTKLVKQRFV